MALSLSLQPPRSNSVLFNDIVARIRKNLVITPPLAQNATFPDRTVKVESTPENENQAVQAEIPFVPSNIRRKEETVPESDSIVTVGQSQRKRKRKVKRPLLSDVDNTAQETIKEDDSEDVNILDAGSDHEPEAMKRKRVKVPGTPFTSQSSTLLN